MRLLTAVCIVLGTALAVTLTGPTPRTSATDYTNPGYGSPVVVPYYTASYQETPPLTKAQGTQILDLLAKIEVNTRPQPVVPGVLSQATLKPKLSLQQVAQKRCVGCHTEANSEEKGGGFILFADEAGSRLKPLNKAERKAMLQVVEDGTMPKSRGKLPDDERAAFSW